VGGKSVVIHLVDARVISHVGQVHGCFDDMLEGTSGRRQNGFEIDDGLARLLDYVIRGHFPGLWIEPPSPIHKPTVQPPSHEKTGQAAAEPWVRQGAYVRA